MVKSADIAGEFIGNLKASGTVTVHSTGRLFGNVEGGGLAVESGAVVVGMMRIGVKEPEPVVTIRTAPITPVPLVPPPPREIALALPFR